MDSEIEQDIDFDTWKSLLRSADDAVRCGAADIVPKGADPLQVIHELKTALGDPDAFVRTCAADTLGYFEYEEASEALRARLVVETDVLTQAYLLSSLGVIGTVEDLKLIAGFLKNDTPSMIRAHAAYGLLELAIDQGLAVAAELCDDKDEHVHAKNFSQLDIITESLLHALRIVKWLAEKHRNIGETGVAQSSIESIITKLSHVEAFENSGDGEPI